MLPVHPHQFLGLVESIEVARNPHVCMAHQLGERAQIPAIQQVLPGEAMPECVPGRV